MRFLLLHPEDKPTHGPWSHQSWDRVIDLGSAGPSAYERWGEFFGCPAGPLEKLELTDFDQIRRTLSFGLGRLVDEHGLDWWELIALRFHEQMERVLRLRKLAAQFDARDEIFVSRSGFYAEVLQILLQRKLHSFLSGDSFLVKLRRLVGVAKKLRLHQQWQIVGDKYDAGYRIRHALSSRKKPCTRPVVLLPTAYVNVSRTLLSYASAVPDSDFLLVTTRQSGWVATPPANVTVARLASYAPGKYSSREYRDLLRSWGELLGSLGYDEELSVLKQMRVFDSVPALLREGLAIRDAWLQVFAAEPVSSVLCADDTNPYTHLPLWIAHERGLPAIACHHGALDGRYLFKRSHADVVLAKGRMEKDYLVNICGLPEKKVEIAAPKKDIPQLNLIVFFSEPIEISGGRCYEVYREVLPKLADLAIATQCELVIKLHPQESFREKRKFADAVLGGLQRQVTRVVEGRLTDELLQHVRFAVTVISTTAVDCALRGIPVFLCDWLDFSAYGYARQFIKFGAATKLTSSEEIAKIPGLLGRISVLNDTRDLWEPVTTERLQQLLSGSLKLAAAV
jgi:hypothetical protein